MSTRIEYSADIGQQKHDYAGTAKGLMLKIGKDYELVEYIERLIIKEKRTRAYYAHPYSAWERGSNENANKLIRRFIPKGADIGKFSHERIKMIEHWINNYPRRIFGGSSSNMVKMNLFGT